MIQRIIAYTGYDLEDLELFQSKTKIDLNNITEDELPTISYQIDIWFEDNPVMKECDQCDNGTVVIEKGGIVESEFTCEDCNGNGEFEDVR